MSAPLVHDPTAIWEPRLRLNLLTSELPWPDGRSPRVQRYRSTGLLGSGQLIAWDRALRFSIIVEQDGKTLPRTPWARKVTFRRDLDALGRVRR